MIQRVLAAGLVAGLIAGLAIAALQQVTTTPLIIAAEAYESAASAHHPAVADEGWKPAPGLERFAATALADVGLAAGYALILLASMLLGGERIAPKPALAWAAGGFAATGLATSLGLAPQLPGAAETELIGRQIWWLATAASTAAAIFLLLRSDDWRAKALGAPLMLLPHIVGAPAPARPESLVPAELAARFSAASLTIQAVMWCFIAVGVGFSWLRLDTPEPLERRATPLNLETSNDR